MSRSLASTPPTYFYEVVLRASERAECLNLSSHSILYELSLFPCSHCSFYDGIVLINNHLFLNWETALTSGILSVLVHYNFRRYFRDHETFDRYSCTPQLHRVPCFDRMSCVTVFTLCRISGSVTPSRFLKVTVLDFHLRLYFEYWQDYKLSRRLLYYCVLVLCLNTL